MPRKQYDYARDADKRGAPKKADPRAGEILEKWGQGLDSVSEQLEHYWLNFLFIEGYQWVWFNQQTQRVDEIPRKDEDAVRHTFNRMRSGSRTIMGKLTQRDLVFEVPPTDADDGHLRGARLAESLLENLRIEQSWEQKREVNGWATWKGGTAAFCVDWDPNASDIVASPTETGERATQQGDVCVTPLNFSEFVCQPGTRDAERAIWWIKSLLLPPTEVQDQFDLPWLPAADGNTTLTPFQAKAMERDALVQTPTTRVLTYYERPNRAHPEGRVCVVVNDQVVFDSKWPFPWKDRLNLALTRETVVETRWSGDTVLTDARGVQVAYNYAQSIVSEHMKRAGNARLAVPQSSIDLMEELTDQPGEILPYADGIANQPNWISPPGMPDWWSRRAIELAEELDDIMGIHQVSRGDAPVNVESGYGLSILAEHDATPIMRMSKEQALAWSKVATMCLKLYEKMVKGAKRKSIVQVPGQPPRTFEWDGSDFKGQTTALVPYDEIVPRSRASQLQFAKDLLQMQVITSPSQFAKVAELPNHNSFMSAVSTDIVRAQRENAMFSLKRACVVEDFDDHMAHIQEHNDFRKSLEYELIKGETLHGSDTTVEQHLRDHIQAHITMASEAAGQQTARAAVGGPALAAAPMQGGAPPVDPAMLAAAQSPAGAPAGPETATGGLSPVDTITEQMLAELDTPTTPE